MTSLPDSLHDLGTHLERAHFDSLAQQEAGAFGDANRVFERHPLRIVVGVERGVPFLQMSLAGIQAEWFDLDLWRSCLEAAAPPSEPRSLAEQARYLRQHLDDFANLAGDGDRLIGCLEEAARRRAESRYGIQLPPIP